MGPDEALIVGEVPDPDHLHLPRDTGMTDLDAVGVADKGRGHGLEVPEVAAPGEAQDISCTPLCFRMERRFRAG